MKEYVEMGLLLDAISVSKLDYLAVTDVVCKVPTSDVVEVVHGYWKGKPIAGYCTVRCSVCGSAFLDNDGRWKYCPNCGAKMDGEHGKKN